VSQVSQDKCVKVNCVKGTVLSVLRELYTGKCRDGRAGGRQGGVLR
jgi:hypothetical protein